MLRRISIITGLVLALALAITVYITLFFNYSDGERAGLLVKMSNKGYVFKTWEGQLNVGTLELWSFSVSDDSQVVKDLQSAVDGGYRVKVYYHEKLFQYSWRGDTKYFVYKVEKVGF